MDDTLFIEIQRLCRLVHERGLRELAIARPEFSISLVAAQPGAFQFMPVVPGVAIPTGPEAIPVETTPEVAAGYAITTPIIGTFYRASSPDAPVFVDIGDTIEAGQTVGIVEAMKVFNEITSDIAGTVIAIPAQNGQLVRVDEPLVILQPLN